MTDPIRADAADAPVNKQRSGRRGNDGSGQWVQIATGVFIGMMAYTLLMTLIFAVALQQYQQQQIETFQQLLREMPTTYERDTRRR